MSCFPSFSDFLFFLSRQIVLNRPVVDEVFKFATGKTPIGCLKQSRDHILFNYLHRSDERQMSFL